jgi:uncharacterized damage-inducible protein DinB
MDLTDETTMLLRYLQGARAALLWKLEGLTEYDSRRPLTQTGTNILGLVKHVAMVEWGYIEAFGRSFPGELPWDAEDLGPEGDMYATSEQATTTITDFYEQVGAHTDNTVVALSLDAVGRVPWWPEDKNEVTLHWILVHLIAETNRHAGHADILREEIDGAAGIREESSNLPEWDASAWQQHVERVEQEAVAAAGMQH